MNTKGYKWIDREIAELDPDTDYDRIMATIGRYRLTELQMDIAYVVNFLGVIKAPHGADTLVYTGKALNAKQKRFEDSLIFFWTIYLYGADAPESREHIEHLNRMHAAIARKLPGNFSHNDDYLMPLAQFAAFEHRLLRMLDMPEPSDHIKRALYNWVAALSRLFTREGGAPIEDLPPDYDGLLRFADEFDARPYPQTENGHRIAESFIEQFSERWFPRNPLIGRDIILTVLSPETRVTFQLGEPRPIGRRIVRAALKAMMMAQRVLPDPKSSILEKKPSPMDSPVLQRLKRSGAAWDGAGQALEVV